MPSRRDLPVGKAGVENGRYCAFLTAGVDVKWTQQTEAMESWWPGRMCSFVKRRCRVCLFIDCVVGVTMRSPGPYEIEASFGRLSEFVGAMI